MDRLPSHAMVNSEEFIGRKNHNEVLISTLKQRLERSYQGGGEKYVERHRSRDKRLPRERIEQIIDPGTAFLELSPLAA